MADDGRDEIPHRESLQAEVARLQAETAALRAGRSPALGRPLTESLEQQTATRRHPAG